MLRIYPVEADNLFIFANGSAAAATNDWIPWTKPPGIKGVHITVIGGGGGGGRSTAGSTSQGAIGGASGGMTNIMIPASFLPETLYLKPGVGGLGATTDTTAGSNGQASYVCVAPTTSTAAVIALANGGGGGLFSNSVAPIATASQFPFFNIFPFSAIAGSDFAGVSSLSIISAGGNGGNISGGVGTNGTDCTGSGPMPASRGGLSNGAAGGHGLTLWKPFQSNGGAGGAGGNTGVVGGRGGDGGYGAGGGGGGGTNLAGTGNGGNGGSGLVIIKCW